MKKQKVINILIIIFLVLLIGGLIAEGILLYGTDSSEDEQEGEETSITYIYE